LDEYCEGAWVVSVCLVSRLVQQAVALVRRVPITVAVFVAVLLVGLITESQEVYYWPVLVQRFGWDLTTLQHGRVYAAWVGLFFSPEPVDFLGILVLLLVTLGPLEFRRGTRLAAVGFFVVGPIASIITLLVLWPFANLGLANVNTALLTPDMGASTACLTCLGMFLIGERGWWRSILLFSLLAALAGLVFQKSPFNFDHLSGYLNGLWVGATVIRWQRRRVTKHSGPSSQNVNEPPEERR
jgi:hypothetical protein